MEQINALNQVAEFHKTFQHPILEKPQIPSDKRCRLRIELIREELKELEQAILDKDMIEIADALCDIQYVLSGAVLEFGLGEKFKKLFDEVQRSNMSKACISEDEALATIDNFSRKGQVCHFEQVDGKYLVYRSEDHKTMKSINYSPADLKSVLED